MVNRDKWFKIIRREGEGKIPCQIVMTLPIWEKDRKRWEKVKRESPHVKIDISQDPRRASKNKYRDEWGCLWHYPGNYLDGQVIEHPLSNWKYFKHYHIPDPEKYMNWDKVEKDIKKTKKRRK